MRYRITTEFVISVPENGISDDDVICDDSDDDKDETKVR
jgi:hypothetical protein